MTTLTQTRVPLETLSMSQQRPARTRGKRTAAYDEEDGDFVFTRGSKRTRSAVPESEPVAAPPKKATRKTKERDEEEVVKSSKRGRPRKMSFSTPKPEQDSISIPKRRSTRLSGGRAQNGETGNNHSAEGTTDYDSIDMVGVSHTAEEPSKSVLEVSNQPTMISLPFSDTPIINRNKELRKKGGSGARRSSLGLRGRRASSLIDNGHSAIPHREVATVDFYKHIEAEGLSEPRRMKQLLTWTGERALGEKPSHGDPNSAASLAARVINESLLKDFSNRSEFSDWFNREETVPTKIIKKPNPRNVEIEENLVGLEERIKRLQAERDQWKALAKPPSLPPFFEDDSMDVSPSKIDASLLDPEQAAIFNTIASSSALGLRFQTADRLRTVTSDLEFQVDQFADGVHKVEQFQATAGRVANKILALSAVRLEERDKKEKEEIGTRDVPMQEVLRSLSRILPENRGAR